MKIINWPRTMQNLKDALEFKEIPKSVFADRVGISPQQLSNYFAGHGVPSAETYLKMQELIEFQTVWSIGGK